MSKYVDAMREGVKAAADAQANRPRAADRVVQLLAELNDAVVAAHAEHWETTPFGWQPLATAPRDRPILAWTSESRVVIVEWDNGFVTKMRHNPHAETITHWCSLPPPPSK